MTHALRLLTLSFLAACLTFPAAAQSWPTKPIRMLVPTGPGTGTDAIARLLADAASPALGQPIVVEDMPGASGVIAMRAAARSAPDGYTMVFTGMSAITSNSYMVANLGYDAVKDFDIVGIQSDYAPFVLSIPTSLPIHSLDDFTGYTKANAGNVSFGVDATTGFGLVAGRLLNKRGGYGMTEVDYAGSPQLMQDAAAGRIQAVISSVTPVRPLVEQGALRYVAHTSAGDFAGLPGVPVISRTLPGVVIDGWLIVIAPAGTPKDAINRVNAEMNRYAAKVEIQQKFLTLGVSASPPNTPAQATERIRAEQANWKALAAELELKAE